MYEQHVGHLFNLLVRLLVCVACTHQDVNHLQEDDLLVEDPWDNWDNEHAQSVVQQVCESLEFDVERYGCWLLARVAAFST